MAVTMKIACVVLFCMVGAATVTEAITCDDVNRKLTDCIQYLQQNGGTPSDACCKGVTDVNNLAKTTTDRRTVCGCLKSAAHSFKGKLNSSNAASLPGKCKVRIPYHISASVDCTKIR